MWPKTRQECDRFFSCTGRRAPARRRGGDMKRLAALFLVASAMTLFGACKITSTVPVCNGSNVACGSDADCCAGLVCEGGACRKVVVVQPECVVDGDQCGVDAD